ncbi:hypothetical protein RQP46_001214 [Phenoliferia psychrophenolica]
MQAPSTPTQSSVLAGFDPLAAESPAPLASGSGESSAASTPLTFKRRTASRSLVNRTGLLGGILSRGTEDEDRVPPPVLQRPDAPTRISIPLRDPNVSDDEDEEPAAQGRRLGSTPNQTGGGSYFMIEDFGVGQGPGGGGEAAVGFWSGIVSSVFFLSQFLTSLLWVSVAEKHGRRAVLFSSLLGNAVTLALFGTSKNLGTALSCRLAMGIFNGAVGVARSAVQSITDPTNESRAFTYMGLSWGLGGIVGSVVGGLAENPVRNHPGIFGDSVLFAEYPYLLPCLISGSVTFSGALLSLFLNVDGGPRDRGIRLPTEKDVERAASSAMSLPGKAFRLIVACVSPRHATGQIALSPDRVALHRSSSTPIREEQDMPTPGSRKPGQYGSAFNGFNPLSLRRTSTKASGSAYGYSERRYPSIRRRSTRALSVGTSTRYAPDYDDDHGDLNFAQRLLLANEPAVFSLSELWVSQATRADEQFSQAGYTESVFEDDEASDQESRIGMDEDGDEPDFFGYGSAPPSLAPSTEDLRETARRQDEERHGRNESLGVPSGASVAVTEDLSPGGERGHSRERDRVLSYGGRSDRYRRASMASSAARGPALFANTGLDPSSLGVSAPPPVTPTKAGPGEPGDSAFNPMAAIPEQRAPSIIELEAGLAPGDEKASASIIRQLPLGMIAQYALVALHGTTCDQVFLSFLVTPIASGGLGLKAAHYAGLVSAMFFFQTLWQFRFYPFMSAPRGPLSHLAMFRLGVALYLPVYFLFPELRGLLSEDGNNFGVMFGMTLLSSIRYLAGCCAYTAVMVLINAMTPPHLVPLANGLAQTAVSLARFIGPLLGGTLWAASIRDGPNAHPYPFNYAAGFVTVGVICFLGLLHSFRIH